MNYNYFKNKKILVIGHTGFKGSWLSLILSSLNAKIYGISDTIPTKPSNFEILKIKKKLVQDIRCDIRDYKNLKKNIDKIKPEIIFHLAAQSLVNESYLDPSKTWTTNLIGTLNLLEYLKKLKNKCTCIIVTSDKCYLNNEWIWGYRENDILGGVDPYSASKASTEILFSSYYKSFLKNKKNIKIASARAGNVIGGGDWNKNRIIPDCAKAWLKNKTVIIRNKNSTRPWQHVLEPLNGYLHLAFYLNKKKNINGESFNFGPNINEKPYSVIKIVNLLKYNFKNLKIKILNNNKFKNYESNLLVLNSDKSKSLISWSPKLNIKDTINYTSKWYYNYKYSKKEIEKFTINQIKDFLFGN